MQITSSELRQKYLDFFKSKGHAIIPSASLIPENDPTVLFNTAGMQPLVPYLLGQKHPEGTRLCDAQKCIRTGDIDDVGDDTHLTFFEMLGNWSLGDYWKEDAIKWSFEFLTKELNIPLERFAVTCFAGDNDAPKDEESAKIWENLGIKKERIAFLPKEDNWWGPAGKTGPCGPDTEMFYWKDNNEKAPEIFDSKDKRWVEIWNDVFMQYVKTEDGKIVEAEQKNIDTGMGLERTLAVLNGHDTVYKTDLFAPIIAKIKELAGITCTKESPCNVDKKAVRVVADHLKAATFIIGDPKGVTPSNVGQGYIVRRLIRRAIRFGKKLGISKQNWIKDIAMVVVEMYKDVYPELEKNKDFIFDELTKEEQKFAVALEKGLEGLQKIDFSKELGKIASWFNEETRASVTPIGEKFKVNRDLIEVYKDLAKKLFKLFQEKSLPPEIAIEELENKHGKIFLKEEILKYFKEEQEAHQELSRTASAGMFKGGLADNSEATTKLHTAAHLMLAGLRKVLGLDVYQKGSNITAERLRFDFSHKEKLTSEQLTLVENFVNDIINKDLPVKCEEMTLDKARELNAMGVFESKYGEKVKVYTVGEGDQIASREICGGPHVEHTGVLGHFKIVKEESSSSGVRRIKAILE